jgi:hypothetical protein
LSKASLTQHRASQARPQDPRSAINRTRLRDQVKCLTQTRRRKQTIQRTLKFHTLRVEPRAVSEQARERSTELKIQKQDQGNTSLTRIPGEEGRSSSAKKRRVFLSQEAIRQLDKYAECPHCDLVNREAGNWKPHWVYHGGHPDHEYDVEDIWIYERPSGTQEPRELCLLSVSLNKNPAGMSSRYASKECAQRKLRNNT